MSTDPQKIGRYEVQSAIGRGSMGVVYLAIDPLLKRSVAVKIMREKGEDVSDTIERFKREAEISAKLNHPNIITVYDVGVDSEVGPFLTMEYIAGASLAHLLGENLPLDSILRLLLQGASALEAAELAGIVHRDVKPENMLVSQEGRLKLMDFGLARGDQSRLTAEGMVFGTPSYTAPELLTGSKPSSATDRYAFAVTAFEAITGGLPYQATSVGSTLHRIVHEAPIIPSALDPALRDIFLRALAKDPGERFQDLTGFMVALIYASPIDLDQRTKLLDGLEYEKTHSGTFVFPSSTPGNTPAPLPTLALPQLGTEALTTLEPSDPIPLNSRRKNGRHLFTALLAMLLLGGLGTGIYFLSSPKKLHRKVEIRSDPAGATVFLEGQNIGQTPLSHVELKKGASALRVKMEGYLSQSYRIQDGEGVVNLVLKRPSHFISVTTDPSGAEVFLDGKSMGLTPVPRLGFSSEGTAKLRIVHEGYLPWEAELDATYPFPEMIRLTPLPKPRR